MEKKQQAIILGLDGATFDVLLPRVEAGEMPHLARLLQAGTWGGLQSTIPPFSAQAWVSLATGKNQARHGVLDFWQRPADPSPGQRRDFVDARLVHGETLWQTAARHGLHAGVVNVPVTYPPQPIPEPGGGYLVSGFLTPGGRDDYTSPRALREEILALVPDYEPDPFDPLGSDQHQAAELAEWMEKHEQVARHLARERPADLFFSVVQALDHLQHLFWDDVARDRSEDTATGAHSGQEGHATVVDRCYHLADEIIGHRAGLLDGSTHLFVVSDHGFGPARKWFHVNRFLQERGLQALGGEGGSGRLAARLGLTPQAVRSAVRRLDVLGLRRRVGRMARVSLGRRIDEQLTPPVDWAHTQAVAGSPATEGIYVNLKGREPHGIVEPGTAYEALRARLVGELRALRDPDTGEPVVQAVYRREEIYDGPFLDRLPDVVFGLGDGPYLASDLLTAEEVLPPLPSNYLQGRHQPTGVFVAAGPGIRRSLHIDGVHIVDVAPTVLYALGLPIPEDMDGRPLLEIFGEEYRAAHPVAYAPPVVVEGDREGPAYDDEDRAEMERRLQGLGYMS